MKKTIFTNSFLMWLVIVILIVFQVWTIKEILLLDREDSLITRVFLKVCRYGEVSQTQSVTVEDI